MTILKWPDFELFEYEYELARREARALLPGSLTETEEGITVVDELGAGASASLTYFSEVANSERREVTLQHQVERRHREITGRKGVRQSTRFLVHDLHEYKGKFNPQMARALINVFGTDAETIIDPFCGSGTTLIEALRLDKNAVGYDKNPIATWISTTKVRALTHANPERLLAEFRAEAAKAVTQSRQVDAPEDDVTCRLWDAKTWEYLQRWFPFETLWPLVHVVAPRNNSKRLANHLVRLAVSNIVRELSWQLPEDLRIRRRAPEWRPPAPSDLLVVALKRVENALLELVESGRWGSGSQATAKMGDAKIIDQLGQRTGRTAIITSPPYATALPYIDTDRLSILLLGLAKAPQIKALDAGLTGSREWNSSTSATWQTRLAENQDRLPDSILELSEAIALRNSADRAGFRRQAVPPLLYRYFAHMQEALTSWSRMLVEGECAVLVVGSNRTGGAQSPILIDTPSLIADCAVSTGFQVAEMIPFQTWPRYGMHSKNAVQGESALVLRRDGEQLGSQNSIDLTGRRVTESLSSMSHVS